MKIFVITLLTIMFFSCKKDNGNTSNFSDAGIEGLWDDNTHVINGNLYEVDAKIDLKSNGTYSSSFTYPWHCIPGADSEDQGTWTYNKVTRELIIKTSKPPLGPAANYSEVKMTVSSISNSEMIVNFISPACVGQNVIVTFKK